MSKMPTLTIGSRVAFNTLPDATFFEVMEIDGFMLTVREYDGKGTNYALQTMDKCFVKQVAINPEFDDVQVQHNGRANHWVLTTKNGATVQSWNFGNAKEADKFGDDLASDYGVQLSIFDKDGNETE